MHPEADIIGTDISPTQASWVPPNVRFEMEDATQPWTFEDNTFDFVHSRWLVGCLTDWNEYVAQAYRVTKPGGWIELVETSIDHTTDDGSVTPDMALHGWGDLFAEAGRKMGRPTDVVKQGLLVRALQAAGYTDVTSQKLKMPSTGWPADPHLRQIGQFAHAAMEQDLEGELRPARYQSSALTA